MLSDTKKLFSNPKLVFLHSGHPSLEEAMPEAHTLDAAPCFSCFYYLQAVFTYIGVCFFMKTLIAGKTVTWVQDIQKPREYVTYC